MFAAKRIFGFLTAVVIIFVATISSVANATVMNDMNGDGIVKMVAMGDSFSSGVGAPHAKNSPVLSSLGSSSFGSSDDGYNPATTNDENACYRSDEAYGPIVARDMGYELEFVACSGSRVSEMLYSSRYGEPVQVDTISADADIITLTAGGNDVGFVDYVTCVVLEECTTHSPAASRTLSDTVNVLPGLMDQLLTTIKSKAPQARVVVLGYAIGLDPRDSGSLAPGGMCFPYFSKQEMDLTYQVRDTLNGVIQQAAVRNGVEYIDPHAPGSLLNTREASICNSSGLSASHSVSYDFFTTLRLGRTAHPTAYAYAVEAEMLKSLLVD